MIGAGELAAMRATVGRVLTDACTIERAVVTSDDQGGTTDAWTPLAAAVPCRVSRPTTGTEAEVGGRLTGVVPWLLRLPAGQDVADADRVVVTSTTPQRRFEVVAVLAPVTDEVVRSVLCAEVQA